MTIGTTEILNNNDVQLTIDSLTVDTSNDLLKITTVMTITNMRQACIINFEIVNIQRTQSLNGCILTIKDDNNTTRTHDLTLKKTMSPKNYLTGNTYIVAKCYCGDTSTKYYIDITDHLK